MFRIRISLGLTLCIALLAAGGLLIFGGSGLLANPDEIAGVPKLMSYQGYLTDAGGSSLDGSYALTFKIYDASSGGTKYWEETHNNVPVNGGYFAVMLGSQGVPLEPAVFAGEGRYLEVSVNGGSPLPRQRIGAAPYALQAYQAQTALEATYATTATVALNAGGAFENVIVVAKSGGDYSSVAAALNSISNPSSGNRYLVYVAPGTYTEADLVDVKPYVHLQGAGPNVTVISSTRSDSSAGASAATVKVQDRGRLSDLTVYNDATSNTAIAVYMGGDATRDTLMDNVVAKARGAGGSNHYAVLLRDAEPTIHRSLLMATGAVGFGSAINAALGHTDADGNNEQPLITDSTLVGGEDDVINCSTGTGTGYALHLTRSSPSIRNSELCGDYRAVLVATSGFPTIEHSLVRTSSNNSAFLVENNSGIASFAASRLGYFSGRLQTGGGNTPRCVVSYDFGTFNELTILCENA